MTAGEVIARCEGQATIRLILRRRWSNQRRIKLLPGGKVTGDPIARLPGGATLVVLRLPRSPPS